MVQFCPRCQRANPPAAAFCHFDGHLLRATGGPPPGQLLQEFVFPSGRRCGTFDELAQGCYAEWDDARRLLRDGVFARYLAGVGRVDLARAATEAQSAADADVGLSQFVAALPAAAGGGPKLGLTPHRLAVGPLHVGETRQAIVRVVNEGRGVLQGNVAVADGCAWLRIADSADGSHAAVKTGKDQTVTVQVDAAGLVAGQTYSTKLTVVTSGGVAELPVRLELTARPFPAGPYQGAASPHELARKMRDNPHPAVRLLEAGDIARWFASNGWAYPIGGPLAPGLAAVQQFFEELGLARAPHILLAEQEFRFRLTPPEIARGQVVIRSPARKLVYARAESDVAWLKPAVPGVSGQATATIPFEVDASLIRADGGHTGTLRVVANAGQAFAVHIHVDVQGVRSGWFRSTSKTLPGATVAPPPADTVLSAPPLPAGAPTPGPPLGRAVLAGALLGLAARLLLAVPADLFARLLGGAGRQPPPGTLAGWLLPPAADDPFLRLFVAATAWVGAIVGVWLVWRARGTAADLACGAVAGTVAGVAAAATVGSALVLGDALPRLLLSRTLGGSTLGPLAATPLWLLAAAAGWLAVGAIGGLLLALSGPVGWRLLDRLGSPLAWLLRRLGLPAAADLFAAQLR